jgi:DNA repair protein RecO (recombination protein O)
MSTTHGKGRRSLHLWDHHPMGARSYDVEAVVLRAIRYSEADLVLTLQTRERGRVSAIAKGARRPTSKLGGRVQPGVWLRLGLVEGRGDLAVVRSADVVDAHAGLWTHGYRLLAASCVLESVLRAVEEHEPGEESFNLLCRTLGILTRVTPRDTPPRLDPVVLGSQCKLLVVAGVFPMLGHCAMCGSDPPLRAFSAHAGGGLCEACAGEAEFLHPDVWDALTALVGHPLADAADACPPRAAQGVEHVISLVLREHLGVTLRSAAPI